MTTNLRMDFPAVPHPAPNAALRLDETPRMWYDAIRTGGNIHRTDRGLHRRNLFDGTQTAGYHQTVTAKEFAAMPETDPHQIYIPVMKAFQNGNSFSGSAGSLRFLLDPLVESNEIRVRIWYGEYCFELSEIVEDRTFPLSDEGREALRDYLTSRRRED